MNAPYPNPYPPDPRTRTYRPPTDPVRWDPIFLDPNVPPAPIAPMPRRSGGSWRWLGAALLITLTIAVAALFRRPIYGFLSSFSRIGVGTEKDLLLGMAAYGLLLIWTLALVRILTAPRTR